MPITTVKNSTLDLDNDLADETIDGTGGFNLVFYPEITGEQNVVNRQFEYGDVRRFGADPSNADNRFHLQSALNSIEAAGGGRVYFPPGADTYDINATANSVNIGDDITLDLGGNTLHRTDSINRRFIGNTNYGTTGNVNIAVINGHITSVGADGNVNDQGTGLHFWRLVGLRLENITTDNTVGDGISYRETDSATLTNITVGNYGRNGISPTSGINGVWNNVNVNGTPFVGANPGLGIDAENDNASERTQMYWNAVVANNATFIDFFTASGGDFSHELYMQNCRIGPGFNAMTIRSVMPTIARNFIIGSSNKFSAGGASSAALQIRNVSSLSISNLSLDVGTATGSPVGVNIIGEVNDMNASFNSIVGFTLDIQCFNAADVLTNSRISGLSGSIFLTGSDNTFYDSNINNFRVSQAASTGNTLAITSTVASTTESNGGLIGEQHFGGIDGSQSKSYFSDSVVLAAGATHDITIQLPPATVVGQGRAATVLCHFSVDGSATQWAQYMLVIRYGSALSALAIDLHNNSGASIGGFSFVSATSTSATIRLTYVDGGVLSATVLG